MTQAAGTGSGGLGLLSALTQGLGGGAEDALTARQNIQGIKAYEANITRGGDAYQQGVNTIIASKYFGQYGAEAVQWAATGMSQDDVEEAARGRFTRAMIDSGMASIGASGFRRFQSEKESTELLQRTVSGEKLPPGLYMETVNKFRDVVGSGGQATDWFAGMSREEQKKTLSDIATAEQFSHKDMDRATAEGESRRILMGYAGGTRAAKRGAASGKIEEAQAAAHAAEDAEFATQQTEKFKTWKADIDILISGTGGLSAMSKSLITAGRDSAAALAAYTATIRALARGEIKQGQQAGAYYDSQLKLNQQAASDRDAAVKTEKEAGTVGGIRIF
jgi:hypothetical protein